MTNPVDDAVPRPQTDVEPASADVDATADATPLPGVHRGGFARLPTAPVDVTTESAPVADDGPYTGEYPQPVARGLAGWALAFSIAGLAVSLFVGWGFPIGLIGGITAIVALRRPVESRQMAVWALALGLVSLLYSAGWLVWAASRANLFG